MRAVKELLDLSSQRPITNQMDIFNPVVSSRLWTRSVKRNNWSTHDSFVIHFPLIFLCSFSDMLPPPALLLQLQDDVWRLQCTASPPYPGAVFSLYLADSAHSVATQTAAEFHHQVTFPVLVQDTPLALYQCQYSIYLGGILRSSERSPPLAVAQGRHVLFMVYLLLAMELQSDLDFFTFLLISGGSSNLTSGKATRATQI